MSPEASLTVPIEKKLYTKRNFWCFALGTFGRDFAYNLFVGNLLSFILFTKSLTDLQFSFVSAIIIVARIFDAFNDPVMGGIVENTRSRFGKFRPWILIGAVSTCVLIVLLFSVPVDGWGFIGFLAAMYFLFSITYTMNDIPYWALLPHLARGTEERNKLSSVTQLVVSAGGGLGMIGIPALTTQYSGLLGGSARSAYMWISVGCAVILLISTAITFFGVKDYTETTKNALSRSSDNKSKLSIKDMFRVLKNNDQLLVAALIMVLYSIGTGVVGSGLISTFVYFNFGYNGLLTTIFSAVGGVTSVLFTVVFPALMKKFGRTRLIAAGGLMIIFGYAIMLLIGLTVPNGEALFSALGMSFNLKFLLMAFPYGIACLGQSCYYNMMFLNMSNTVEYNEWKTGNREEGLIFSLRPFTAKFSTAIQQLLIMIVYLSVGILEITNGISALDRQASQKIISNEEMLEKVNSLLTGVPDAKRNALLVCMCLIPIAFMVIAMLLYKKKFVLNDETYEKIKLEIARRNACADEDLSLPIDEPCSEEPSFSSDEPCAEAETSVDAIVEESKEEKSFSEE